MENKVGVGFIVFITVAILVGLAFWTPMGANISTLTQTKTSSNVTFTIPTGQTWFDLAACGQKNTSAVVIFNATGNVEIPADNYTIRQGTSATDGYLATQIKNVSFWSENAVTAKVTCTYEPKGYIADGAGRNIALLIPIFFALAIAFVAFPDVREWIGSLGGSNK